MLLRDMPCEAAIARPDKPSARNCRISFALIFRTISDGSFRRVPNTRGGGSVSRVAPEHTITGPHAPYRATSGLAPKPATAGPQRSKYSSDRAAWVRTFTVDLLRIRYLF